MIDVQAGDRLAVACKRREWILSTLAQVPRGIKGVVAGIPHLDRILTPIRVKCGCSTAIACTVLTLMDVASAVCAR